LQAEWAGLGLRKGALRQSSWWRLDAIGERQLDRVVADIFRPCGNQADKSATVVGEQGARGFLEAWQIA
jgi:hypothetical protein